MRTNSIQAWFIAVRPYSLCNAVILVMVATALAAAEGAMHPIPALLCLAFAVLMQIVANLVNDLCDFLKGADRADRLGPDRAFAKGYITPRAMKWGIALFTAAAAMAGLAILWWALRHGTLLYDGRELVACGAACIIFAYLYTAGPFPLAYNGLGDVAVIIFFGLVPVGFTCYVQCGEWGWPVTAAALACGLAIDTMLMLNNFRDYEQDIVSRKRTVVVLFGRRFGSLAYLALGIVAAACGMTTVAPERWWATLLALPYLILHVATWRTMERIGHGTELNRCLGMTSRNIMLFGILLTAIILLGR